MNAPLSLFLTHFSAVPPPPVEVEEIFEELPVFDPGITLAPEELETRLEAAAEAARADAQGQHEEALSALTAQHQVDRFEALATARAEWVASVGGGIGASLDSAIADLRNMLADRIADVLRPLIANTVMARAKTEVLDALDRLLADPSQPVLSVRGPEDLCATLRAARPEAAIEWVVGDAIEVAITADATRIETRLAEAMADIAATER